MTAVGGALTAWAAQLATRDDVTWNAVQEAHQSWDYHSQGLTALASAIIAIAVTAATMGAGSQAIGLTLSTNAAGEVAGGTLAGYSLTAGEAIVVSAAADAGFSALVSQATVSLINNQGDLGKTLEDLGSLETVKSIAISMGTAAAFAEVGNLTDGHFGGRYGVNDAGESLNAAKQTASDWMGTEQYFENVLGHAVVGCASGAASGGSCASGAASAAVSDAVTPVYSGASLAAGTALSAGTGAATAALTGGSAAQGAITGAYGYLYNFISNSVLRATVPGQVSFDNGMTALEENRYGSATLNFLSMLGEQVLSVLTFGIYQPEAVAFVRKNSTIVFYNVVGREPANLAEQLTME